MLLTVIFYFFNTIFDSRN
jgi:hypothetical protein